MAFRISSLTDNNAVVSPKGLKNHNLPHILIWMIYYAWVIVFSTWWTASPLTENVFDANFRSIIQSVNLMSSAVFIMIIKKEWFVRMAQIGALLIIVGMGIFMTVPAVSVQLVCAIIIGISLGSININILIQYVFSLNNTEKLYAVVGSNLLINLLLFFQNANEGNNLQTKGDLLFSFIFLSIALSAIIFFKKRNVSSSDFDDNGIDNIKIPRRVYLTLFFNCVISILCKGVGTGILKLTAESFGNSVVVWSYIGGLAGCLIYFVLYAFASKAFLLLGNITFAFVSMSLLFYAFIPHVPVLDTPFAILFGIGNTVGMINMYYIVGVVSKKYNSIRYLKFSIIIIGVCGGVAGVVMGNFIHRVHTYETALIASVISAFIMMFFTILSPLLANNQYYSDWARDSELMDIDNNQSYLFRNYSLSKREIEVCKLLLQGYTLRQISAILLISYSTVNTYCTCLYRKLNINSRTELMILFKDYVAK